MLIQIRAQYLSHNCIMNGVTDLGTATNHSQRFRLDENVNTRNSQWRAQSYNQNHMSYVAQDDYYFDNFTDTEDTNTPDVLYESSNVYHKQIQFKVNNNLSRMSSRESMEYISNTLVDNSNYRGGANAATVMSPIMMQNAPGQIAKCRQLPCRTFISTGSCPYGDRCVFLHDACIASKPVYIKSKVCAYLRLCLHRCAPFTVLLPRPSPSLHCLLAHQRKSKEDMCVDAFFWPTMPLHAVMGRVDHRNRKWCYRRQ